MTTRKEIKKRKKSRNIAKKMTQKPREKYRKNAQNFAARLRVIGKIARNGSAGNETCALPV